MALETTNEAPPSRAPRLKKARRFALRAGGVLLVIGVVGTFVLLRDPLPRMMARRSAVANVTEGLPVIENGHVMTPVRVTAASGLTVDIMVRTSPGQHRRSPLAIILGGHLTGSRSVKLIGETPGVVVAGISYPFDGDPRPSALTFLRDLPAIRGAFLDTPPAVQLALDYLLSRPDVDPARVEAIGVSLGAPFVTIAGALDPRITRVWAVHGSGGSYAPLESNMRRSIKFAPLRAVAAATATVIIAGPHLDPVRWVPHVAPRPFMMVNATDDERMPKDAVERLYQSAGEPKELIWMPGRHIRGDSATISGILAIVLSRINVDARQATVEPSNRAAAPRRPIG